MRWSWWRKIREPKCCFCKQGETDSKSPPGTPMRHISWGIYGGTERYYYHQGCMRSICKDPESFGHNKVDMALRILEEIADRKRRQRDYENHFNVACQQIKEMECD